MTSFVESCVETVTGSAEAVERRTRRHPRGRQLIRLLRDRRNILVTTHIHPDPDALASAQGMQVLLQEKIPGASVDMAIKGRIAGGINEAFARESDLSLTPWDEARLGDYDAIVLLDCQPPFSYNPLPPGTKIDAVVDHHRSRGARGTGKLRVPHWDVRPNVGATCSIVFGYLMELEVQIPRVLGASLMYAIESDLAGAASTPSELDNIALAGLTLIADPKVLYRMRYMKLSQSYYSVLAEGIGSASVYENAVVSHLTSIDSLEKPAVLADALLRFERAEWSMVTAAHEGRLVVSLRTSSSTLAAADVMARILRGLGEGGGHRAKAGGSLRLDDDAEPTIQRVVGKLRRRFLSALGLGSARGTRLVPRG